MHNESDIKQMRKAIESFGQAVNHAYTERQNDLGVWYILCELKLAVDQLENDLYKSEDEDDMGDPGIYLKREI